MKYFDSILFDEKLDRESLANDEVLQKSEHFLAVQTLESIGSATTLPYVPLKN